MVSRTGTVHLVRRLATHRIARFQSQARAVPFLFVKTSRPHLGPPSPLPFTQQSLEFYITVAYTCMTNITFTLLLSVCRHVTKKLNSLNIFNVYVTCLTYRTSKSNNVHVHYLHCLIKKCSGSSPRNIWQNGKQ